MLLVSELNQVVRVSGAGCKATTILVRPIKFEQFQEFQSERFKCAEEAAAFQLFRRHVFVDETVRDGRLERAWSLRARWINKNDVGRSGRRAAGPPSDSDSGSTWMQVGSPSEGFAV
jgi:hypothetical protein